MTPYYDEFILETEKEFEKKQVKKIKKLLKSLELDKDTVENAILNIKEDIKTNKENRIGEIKQKAKKLAMSIANEDITSGSYYKDEWKLTVTRGTADLVEEKFDKNKCKLLDVLLYARQILERIYLTFKATEKQKSGVLKVVVEDVSHKYTLIQDSHEFAEWVHDWVSIPADGRVIDKDDAPGLFERISRHSDNVSSEGN